VWSPGIISFVSLHFQPNDNKLNPDVHPGELRILHVIIVEISNPKWSNCRRLWKFEQGFFKRPRVFNGTRTRLASELVIALIIFFFKERVICK